MENTFWNISSDGNFVKLFEKSFTLYAESGTREKVEADIENLGSYWDSKATDEEYKDKFTKIIMEHYLRKFPSRLFLFAIDTPNHFI